ncbi:MAG TPA: hypothetical protein DCZ91_20005 [Lachnospiraceae bacterium]|nr:hypothetical protein [Lachnospiraceae bacterium]
MNRNEGNQQQAFSEALEGKKIPILTLDNKWYQLFTQEKRQEVSELEQQLNTLLKQQGRLNNEIKEIKRLKKGLMSEIVALMDEAGQEEESENSRKIDQNRTKVEECNELLESRQDELLDLPKQIDQANFRLMLATMDCCYDTMKENTEEIQEIARWVSEIRVELKKKLIRKQEMEQRNHAIYSYMHDVFGAEVIDIFDLQYNPEEQHPT